MTRIAPSIRPCSICRSHNASPQRAHRLRSACAALLAACGVLKPRMSTARTAGSGGGGAASSAARASSAPNRAASSGKPPTKPVRPRSSQTVNSPMSRQASFSTHGLCMCGTDPVIPAKIEANAVLAKAASVTWCTDLGSAPKLPLSLPKINTLMGMLTARTQKREASYVRHSSKLLVAAAAAADATKPKYVFGPSIAQQHSKTSLNW
mmetsp:Transcript_19071/g.53383  ORF Transcript_19071/g.53383 Transcript_19071/m.53383 type:complete len:208 (+) Transcript_19071:1697-2320(+)